MARSVALSACFVVSLCVACSGGENGATSPPSFTAGAAGAPAQVITAGSGGDTTTPMAGSAGTPSMGGSSDVGGGAGTGTGGGAGAAAAGASGAFADDPGTDGDGMFKISGYTTAPEYTRAAGVPKGVTFNFTFAAKDSVIYPKAIDRKVVVYVPTQYKMGTLAGVLVVQDGTDFYGFDSSVPAVLDNLISTGKIPPIVCVFTGNGGGDYIGSERGLEYDTVSGMYAKWVDTELLPRVEKETATRMPTQAVTFTHNPEGRASMGGSSGGAASFSMVWWRPDLFRRVITFSGTYVNQVASGTPFKHGAWIYHDIDPYNAMTPNGLIMNSCQKSSGPKTASEVEPCDTPTTKAACEAVSGCMWNDSVAKPIRAWLEAGTKDNEAGEGPSSYRDFLLANQRMAASLMGRKYHFHYDEAAGATHVDQGPLRQTLPSALTWLWRGYKAGT